MFSACKNQKKNAGYRYFYVSFPDLLCSPIIPRSDHNYVKFHTNRALHLYNLKCCVRIQCKSKAGCILGLFGHDQFKGLCDSKKKKSVTQVVFQTSTVKNTLKCSSREPQKKAMQTGTYVMTSVSSPGSLSNPSTKTEVLVKLCVLQVWPSSMLNL